MSQAQLRITHLVESLERGGLERVVVDLVLEQVRQGHSVQVICLFREGLLAQELSSVGIRVITCNKVAGLDLRAARKLRRLLRIHKTQVLHSHNPVPHYYGVLASGFMRGLRIGNTRHGMGNAPFQIRRELLFRISLMRTSFVAMVCESALRNFVHHRIVASNKATVVPNGIPLGLFKPHAAGAQGLLRQELNLGEGVVCIGTVSRLNPVKDHVTLLHAMARVHAEMRNAALVIVGDGALRGELEALARNLKIESAVYFLGDRNDVNELLPGFDIFALPSLSEGYSISLLEACASGLPIVATDVGGNAEIVKPGVNGLLVAPGNAETLADSILKLAKDGELRSAMGKRGREWVEANGTIEVMAQRYMALYSANRP